MSRFGNLELDGESEERQESSRPRLKDEKYYLEEARAAFERGEFEPALRHYSKVLEYDTANPAAWASSAALTSLRSQG